MEFFKKLTNIIKEHKSVIIMTHKNPDLDGLSSAVCLYKIIETFGIETFIYDSEDELNTSVVKMYDKLTKNNVIINKLTKKTYKKELSKEPLLIVVDVNNIDLVENSSLLDEIKDIVVIDHHIKSTKYIKKTVLTYQNSNLSSIAELMTNYSKYLNKTPSTLLATILLTAIEIDTNSFNIKTTESTYQTAAYLSKIGADNKEKQELLKESKEQYIKKVDLIKDSYMINENIAICILDSQIYQKSDLATISEELLQFENVEVAITIGKTDKNKVGASARSIGNIDVEGIMKKVGGGGHIYEAATEKENTTINELLKEIEEIL